MKNDTIMTRLISGLVMAVLLGLPVQDGFAQSHRDSSNSAMGRIVRQLKAYQDSVNRNNGYPGVKRIQRDLVGHSLAEGVDNGYRPTEWRWKIEEGQISDFKILKVLEKTKEQYLFEAKMRLSNGYYAYDAKVKIKYVFTSEKQWKLDYVVSQGMHIVVTHEYDEYVRAEIVSDGWGGTKCVQFTNRSELSLIIGGDVFTSDGWVRFTVHVAPHESAMAGGLFRGGSVSDYRINFIARIN